MPVKATVALRHVRLKRRLPVAGHAARAVTGARVCPRVRLFSNSQWPITYRLPQRRDDSQ